MQTSQLNSSLAQYHIELTWEAAPKEVSYSFSHPDKLKSWRLSMVSGTSRKKLGRILKLSQKSYFRCSKEQPATLISCLGACSRTPIDTTCKELCVRKQSQTLPGFTSSKSMLIFCKLPSVLHGCRLWFPGLQWISACWT